MKHLVRPTGIAAVIASLPWCCVLPGLLSVIGLAGAGAAAVDVLAGPAEYVLLGLSVLFLGRAHYLASWRGHGTRWSTTAVWISTVMVVLLWLYQFGGQFPL